MIGATFVMTTKDKHYCKIRKKRCGMRWKYADYKQEKRRTLREKE